MQNHPSEVTYAHSMCFIYLWLTSVDGKLDENETSLLTQKPFGWFPNDPEKAGRIFQETLDWYFSVQEDSDELSNVLTKLTISLGEGLNDDMKRMFLSDCKQIIEADGFVHELESKAYVAIAELLGYKIG